ncbi:MAG: glycosyltransferase family 4 protein [Chloroflexota bacterium]|jgi:glycosyltransferase involved in cell wall biosynthesis
MIDDVKDKMSQSGSEQAAASRPGRLRLAYVSPLPPTHSGIADYSWQLLPYLDCLAEITVFCDQRQVAEPGPEVSFTIRPLADFPAIQQEFDLALYHMGNNVLHESLYRLALRCPGVVVLHDHGLGHFIASTLGTAGRFDEYVRELGYAQGMEGVDLAWRVRYGARAYPLHELPLNDRLLDRSLAVIVHSQTTAGLVRRSRPEIMVGVVAQPMPVSTAVPDRAGLSLPEEALIFASVGQVTAAKRLDLALAAFNSLRADFPETKYLIVGEAADEVDLEALTRQFGAAGAVRLTGYAPSLPEFESWTAAADVVVSLRQPTIGETSAAALRALAVGRPLIVFDHGWYSELPDEVCLKVRPGDEQGLLNAMRRLASHPAERLEMGRQARRYIEQKHHPAAAAEAYVDFLRAVLTGIERDFEGR